MTVNTNHQRAANNPVLNTSASSKPEDTSSSETSLLASIQERLRRKGPEATEEKPVRCSCAPVPSPDRLDEFTEDDDSRAAIRLGGNGF